MHDGVKFVLNQTEISAKAFRELKPVLITWDKEFDENFEPVCGNNCRFPTATGVTDGCLWRYLPANF